MDHNHDIDHQRLQNKRKRLYCSYLPDTEVPIPRTTLWRRKKLARELAELQNEAENSDSAESTVSSNEVRHDEDEHQHSPENSGSSSDSNNSRHLQLHTSSTDSASHPDSSPVQSDSENSDGDDLDATYINNTQIFNNSEFNIKANPHVSLGDLLYMVYSFSVRHNLTQIAIKDLLNMLNIVLGDTILPSSIYMFEKTFLKCAPKQIFHLYCSNCENYLLSFNKDEKQCMEGSCASCHSLFSTAKLNKNSFFVTISLKEQLEMKLKDCDFQNILNISRQKKSKDFISKDRLSGSVYKTGSIGQFLKNRNNLSLTVNTDGAKRHKSANQSAWPIFVTVDQVPCECQCPMLVGLWYGKQAPNMHTFFKPLTAELGTLFVEGITWSCGSEVNVSTKFVVSCFTSDIPARAKVFNFIGHMGHFSCLFCTNPGEIVNVGRGGKVCKQVRYPEGNKTFELRTDEDFFEDIKLAVQHGDVVRGIKGSNPLIELPLFKIPLNVAIDVLHNVCKGEMLAFINTVKAGVGKPYYIGAPQTIRMISQRLSTIKPVSCIARLARPLEDMHFYSAKEWLHFLLFFGPISLHGILSHVYLEMFCDLSEAIYILVADEVSNEDVDFAEELIYKYVINCALKFGPKYCVSNNHLLIHLADDVRKFGSLFNHSTFEFESANGWLLKFIKSSKGVMQQAIKNYLLSVNLKFFLTTNNITISPDVKEYTLSLLTGRRRKHAYSYNNATVLGKGILSKVPLAVTALLPLELREIENHVSYERMVVSGYVYSTYNYSSKQQHDDSCFATSDNKFFQIHGIFKFPNKDAIFLSCKRLYLENESKPMPKHIKKISVIDPTTILLELKFSMIKIMLLQCSLNSYVSKLPSTKMVD